MLIFNSLGARNRVNDYWAHFEVKYLIKVSLTARSGLGQMLTLTGLSSALEYFI